MSFIISDSGHSIIGNSVTTGALMVLGSNSDRQSRLRNESISGHSIRGGEHLHMLIASMTWDWTMTTRRGCLFRIWRAFETGGWTSHRQGMPWVMEE